MHQHKNDATLLVTMALPYANSDVHLGHLVEATQTDIFVRFSRMTGRRTVYVCADDTHGTPIEINALKQGITAVELIEKVWKNHVADYTAFGIDFDLFYSTNSPENKKWAEFIYAKLVDMNLISQQEIQQYYCETDLRFLPDRFITGICPRCGAPDQYGDVCEKCGSTYDPTELKQSRCIICKNEPVLKKSTHFFVALQNEEPFLREYLQQPGVLQDDMRNFILHWLDQGLKQWCISRDGPYFGFPIPGTLNKYFYVWLDAPIGYISSTEKWCSTHDVDVASIWGRDAPSEIVHFIGKDIVYFHTLFWPVLLRAAELKLPSRYVVHGFLTMGGERMSKSRGSAITARQYLERVKHPLAADYLRFYFGSKLSNHVGDMDFLPDDFIGKINATLINNIGNLHHRTFVFIERFFDKTIPDAPWDNGIAAQVETIGEQILGHFHTVEFKTVIEKVHNLGSIGNKYFQDSRPWELIKTDRDAAASVMTTCANIVKACAVFLKPFIPRLIGSMERQLGIALHAADYTFSLRGAALHEVEKVFIPLEREHLEGLFVAPEGVPEKSVDPEDAVPEPQPEQIDISDVSRLDLRIGSVIGAQRIKKSGKLIKLTVDTGSGNRQIVAGIGASYSPELLVGKQIVFVANLKPAMLMGTLSEGMLLAVQSEGRVVLVTPEKPIPSGAKVS